MTYHNSPQPSNARRLQAALAGAKELNDDLVIRTFMSTIVAHYRGNQISLSAAAKACKMSEDDFRRACAVVDDEARKYLARGEELANGAPPP